MLRDPRPRVLVPVVPRTGLWWPVLACFALAAISLLEPSAPTYDPWAWIIWGREVMHLDLDTVSGPRGSRCRCMLTAPFSLLGDEVAPSLWLVVARAGSLGALIVTFRLGARLGGIAAGLVAALLLLASPWLVRNALLGNSEGLLILFVLWSVERHIAGRYAQAFALGIAAGLLRPEAWPFLALYALWLLWQDRRRLPWVAGGLALLPLLWLLPELWGSGDLWRASERANTPNPNSAAFADRPGLAVLGNWLLLLTPPAWIGLAAAHRPRRPRAHAEDRPGRRHRAARRRVARARGGHDRGRLQRQPALPARADRAAVRRRRGRAGAARRRAVRRPARGGSPRRRSPCSRSADR